MNIFAEDDYRKVLRKTVESRKQLDRSINFQALASAMRIQKAYLSSCLMGRADLSLDQMYLACTYLGFDKSQRDYLMLLLELSRCGLEERREELEAQIKAVHAQHLQSHKHLQSKVVKFDEQHLSAYL